MQKIFCVEDDESIRELILCALSSGGFKGSGFESSAEFFKVIENEQPDLILLDIMLPVESGYVILQKLKQNPVTSSIPVIMLTAKSSEFDKVKGLDLGADDYIIKPFGIMELLSRIRAVLRRINNSPTNAEIISCKNITINIKKRLVLIDDNEVSLTYKEFELLSYLIKNNGIVLSRDTILSVVWGFDYEGESRTVDMHIKTLRQKLSQAGCTDVIHTVRSVGYKFEI